MPHHSPHQTLSAIGSMSGTSLDGIDLALIVSNGISVLEYGSTLFVPYDTFLKNKIKQCLGHKPDSPQARQIERILTDLHADAVTSLLKKSRLQASDIDVMGFHGQTILHQPPLHKGAIGQTFQLGDGQRLANLIRIPVINQFRQNDMRHGGQGAPLVPIYHWALCEKLSKPSVVLNIGGVANVTWIGEGDASNLLAFDTGPGNALIDDWVQQKANLSFDQYGHIASQGIVCESLLEKWLSLPYFSVSPPKTLDRNAFKKIIFEEEKLKNLSLEDGAATLTAFTAQTILKSQTYFKESPRHWIVAGGGVHNKTLMQMISKGLVAGQELKLAQDRGWNGDMLEAQAFAYLAVRGVYGLPLSFPLTTGVPYPVSGGTLFKPV